MGCKIRIPPACGKTYCQACINGWYSYGQDSKISCPACQKICFCTRCNRFDNIEKFSQIYERLGGNIVELVRESPCSQLATRLFQSNTEFSRNLNKLYEQKKNKESMAKELILSPNASFNVQYKKLHLMRLISRLVVVVCVDLQEREEFKKTDLVLNNEHFNMVVKAEEDNKPVVWLKFVEQTKGRQLGKRLFGYHDRQIRLGTGKRGKYDFDCNSTKSSSGRPLALAVTGDRDKSSQEDMGFIQKKINGRGEVYAETYAKLARKKGDFKRSAEKAKLLKTSRKRLKNKKTSNKT